MRNHGHYKRNLLSAAVLTLLLGGQAMGANFTTTLTGDAEKDKEYANVYMDFAESYMFDGNDTIKVSGASAIKASKDLKIDSPGNLTLITDTGYTYGIDQGTANNVNISLNKNTLTIQSRAEGRTEGIHMDKTSGKRQTMNIKGNVDITSVNTTGGYALGAFANGLADLHVTGSFKAHVDGQNVDAGGGPLSASAVYASGLMNGKEGAAKVLIDGSVDLSGNANGLTANVGGASIEAKGGRIEMNQDNTLGFAALRASNAAISMNMKTVDGQVVSAGNKVDIKGNVVASTSAVNAADTHGTSTRIRLGLDTKDSSLEGGIYNAFGNGIKAGSLTFTGETDLWLSNGAVWKNHAYGKTTQSDYGYGGNAFDGSVVTNFQGGKTQEKAGHIFQLDDNDLTIGNYSGFTNIYFAHNNDGSSTEDYDVGDVIIQKAAAGSSVTLITDQTGLADGFDDAKALQVLRALAGKLTYGAYATDQNLVGSVQIASGLTAGAKTLKSGAISFGTDGKGNCVKLDGSDTPDVPGKPSKTEFSSAITGDTATDTEYADNIKEGKYIFDADTTITATGISAAAITKASTIDAGSHSLTLTAKGGDFSKSTPVLQVSAAGTTTITAGTVKVDGTVYTNWTYDRDGVVTSNGAKLDVNGNMIVNASNATIDDQTYVMKADGKSEIHVKGDLSASTGESFASVYGLYAADTAVYGGAAAKISVDGKVDIHTTGNAVTAYRNGSSVALGGGTIMTDQKQANSKEHYALVSDGGHISVNMNEGENGAGTIKTVIHGNLKAIGEKAFENYDFDGMDSIIDIGLSGKDSSWTGVSYANDLGGKNMPFAGVVNLYLSNGAVWNNEAWGKTNDAFNGSHISKLTGSGSTAVAGVIYQKDANPLTIDHYSGNTTIIYQGSNNGKTYAAGDTIIQSADKGSYVKLIGENTGIDVSNADAVKDAMTALVSKLYYKGYIGEAENNLKGQVQIASGLTASSQLSELKDIIFSKDNGQGGLESTSENVPGEQISTTFTDAITGDSQSSYRKAGVQKEDLSYVFSKESTIRVNQMTRKEKNDSGYENDYAVSMAAVQTSRNGDQLTIDAKRQTLKLQAVTDKDTKSPTAEAGILTNRLALYGIDNSTAGAKTSVTADTLDIQIENTYSRKKANGNKDLDAGTAFGIFTSGATTEITAATKIKAHGFGNVYGVRAENAGKVTIHGALSMEKSGDDWAIDNVINGSTTSSLNEATWRGIAGIYAAGAGTQVAVDGKTTIAAHGSGVVAVDGGTVNVGEADIEIRDNTDEGWYAYHAIGSALGTANVGGEGKTVKVKGNVGLFGKQGQSFGSDVKTSTVNLVLNGSGSTWTGAVYQHFTEEETAKGYEGAMNLTLSDGASWTNEKYGYTYGDKGEKYQFEGSRVTSFTGGSSAEKAGKIYQNDSHALTIDNYKGFSQIYYKHDGLGTEAADYKAGDVVISKAEKGAFVSLITENSGNAAESDYAKILNALAQKLTYTGNDGSLKGSVTLASGFTASSQTLKTGDITFTKSGKGSYADEKPGNATDFNKPITGDLDQAWVDGGIRKEDGKYVMDKDITITMQGEAGIEATKSFAIEAGDHTLTITNRTKAGGMQYGAHIGAAGDYSIQAKKLSIEVDTTGGSAYSAIGIGLGDMGSSNKASLTIDGDVDIRAKGEGMAFGVYSLGEQKLTITGNVNMKSETGEGWGIDNPGTYPGALGHYHTNGLYAGFGAGSITVNGGVDLFVKGTGMQANGGATIVVNGGGHIKIAEDTKADQYALVAEAGTVSFHWKDLASCVMNDSDVHSDVQMIGNVGVLNKDSGASPNDKNKPAEVRFTLDTKDSLWQGVAFNQYKEQGLDSGTIRMGLMNGATWINSAYGMVRDGFKGSRISDFHGGSDAAHAGNIFQNDTKNITIDNYSGNTNIFYAHTGNGEAADNYAAGDTIIKSAAAGSAVSLITANNGIAMDNKDSVANVLNALAGKLTYSNFATGEKNLTGVVKIADGLTASSQALQTGKIDFSNTDGKGSLVEGTVVTPGVTPAPNPQPGTGTESPKIEEGDYETFVMKGARSAVTTSFHSWRDNMQDTYTGADLADEDGIFAKALGGKTSSDVSGLKDSNSYWGAQIGYDKALANGWHTGVAFDYRDGDSDYLLGGKGDNKLYSFGVYGVKKMEDGSYFRVAAKAGRVENEYDVYTELRNKLHADYKANAYGLTAEYGKTFGSEMSYITPKVQLTWSRVGSKDYTGSANNGAIMNIYQDSYDSLIGRLGFEAGMKKAHGSLHAGLYLAHEFSGDIDTRYFAKDGGWKSTSFDGDDTWAELVLGGEYRLGRNTQLYADFARDLGGDFQRKWKLNAGIRLRF